MSLMIDCIRPTQTSTPSLPQLRINLKDALYTPTLTRIITLSSNIMKAAEACIPFSPAYPIAQLQTLSTFRQLR